MNREEILHAISEERDRQDAKWGTNFEDRCWQDWVTILMEEVGEVANAVLEEPHELHTTYAREKIRKELIQVAAVAVSALEFGAKARNTF